MKKPLTVKWTIAKNVAKASFLIFLAVYILTLPAYMFLVAAPMGWIDALLPLEAVACVAGSILCFGWAGVTLKETIRL